MYAVRDSVVSDLSDSKPKKPLDKLQMNEFLPTPKVHAALVHDLVLLIPRILVQYLPAYELFKQALTYHIPHRHLLEMSKKSQVVSI